MFHRKIPSFSFTKEKDKEPASPSTSDDERQSRSRSRGRSLSPFRRSSSKGRDPSAEGLRRNQGAESEGESDSAPVVCPSNAFDESDWDSEEEEEDLGENEEEEEALERNTEANSSGKTPLDFLGIAQGTSELTMTFQGEGPNLLAASDLPTDPTTTATPLRRRPTKSEKTPSLKLQTSRPVFEKNRCTVTLTHGDPDGVEKKRKRKYLVASDLSEESLYAIQWSIGTVLRDGDECWVVSVMETDTKFDSDSQSSSEKKNKINNQKDRQLNAAMLARQATALLERTRLNVRVYCQAIHAKNARHMLVDMIDYHEPTMVIIGTRGLTKLKGMLLGSVSNYLIQKSSSPVMVTRRPLRLARTVHKKLSLISREPRVALADAAIEKESQGGAVNDDPKEPEDIKEEIKNMEISDK
ncbi:Usp (universal stress protein) family protein [Pseudohyphozyma bogoriensis]|nr:Usp (universal stress protein) family protein [Pseudohyphozyma bogoriensis]